MKLYKTLIGAALTAAVGAGIAVAANNSGSAPASVAPSSVAPPASAPYSCPSSKAQAAKAAPVSFSVASDAKPLCDCKKGKAEDPKPSGGTSTEKPAPKPATQA